MRIGLTFSVRSAGGDAAKTSGVGLADDAEEEFDSPETIHALRDVLTSLGHQVDLLGDGESMVRRLLDGPRPDLVFNIAEGRGVGRSREARVPAFLELLEIPYTGSDPLTLAATLDKDLAKRLIRDAGIATPGWVLVDGDVSAVDAKLLALKPPFIVKPAFEGSSKGVLSAISVVDCHEDLPATIARFADSYRQAILVEEFIDGEELTVGVLGNGRPRVIGVMRVLPTRKSDDRPFVYSIEVKRDWERLVRYECPAKIPAAEYRAVEEAALACWRTLGCRDVSRFDFRLRDGVPYFLEVNPLPGLSPKSGDLVILSRLMGMDHRELIQGILEAAVDRLGMRSKIAAAAVVR